MNRRGFLSLLLFGSLLGLTLAKAGRAAPERRILIQASPVAGSQHHHGAELWPRLAVGQPLTLMRESRNPHDCYAVALYWQDRKLGYIPQRENIVAAQMLDRREALQAAITQLTHSDNPWQRVHFKVEAVM